MWSVSVWMLESRERTLAAESSPPTARVLDVLELVARRGDHALRGADIARELGLSRATSHAILRTLTDRGWLVRSSGERLIGLGPGLALITTSFAEQRTVTRLALRAASGLAAATNWRASVVELVEETMYVSTIDPGESVSLGAQRMPYLAPFGTLFAVWATDEERLEWLRRGRLSAAAIAAVGAHLDQARADGVLIERMSSVVEHVTSLLAAADGGDFPEAVRLLAGELLEEIVRTGLGQDDPGNTHPVTSIAAPIPDAGGRVATALVLHPFQELTKDEIRRASSMVRHAASSVIAQHHD